MVDARADDALLVEAARAGDRDAFAAIFDRYAPRVHAFCTRLLNEPHTASDATQDTFVTAAQRLDQLRDPTALRAWLYAIARNECTRHGRARSRAVPTEDAVMAGQTGDDLGADEPARAAAAAETEGILWEAAEGLDDSDRILLELHVRHGLEGAELAEAAGVSPGQISMVTGRMRERVARSVGALLIARKGRADCPGLQVVLTGWDGTYDVLTRKRVARHIDNCELCDERRAALVAPFGALAVGPALVAFQLPDGALDRVRDTVLAAFDQHVAGAADGGAGGAAGAADAGDPGPGPDPVDRRKRRALAALAVLAIVALVAIVSVAGGSGGSGDDTEALRSEDGPSVVIADRTTTTSDGRATTTAKPKTTSTSTAPGTTPNGSATTTVPGEVANPGNPSGGPQATVPPSIGGPPVTLVPHTVPPAAPNQPPSVATTSRSPAGATMQTTCNPANDTRTISVGAADDRGIAEVVLRWTQSGGGSGQRTMTRSGSTWTATLGPFPNPGTVTYRAVAIDTNGASTASPNASIGVDPCPG